MKGGIPQVIESKVDGVEGEHHILVIEGEHRNTRNIPAGKWEIGRPGYGAD